MYFGAKASYNQVPLTPALRLGLMIVLMWALVLIYYFKVGGLKSAAIGEDLLPDQNIIRQPRLYTREAKCRF
jgi:hypothetical protein